MQGHRLQGWRSGTLASIVASAVLILFSTAFADLKPAQEKLLNEAREDYEVSAEKAKEMLLSRFDKAMDVARAGGTAAADRAKLLEELKAEKDEFELRGRYPLSITMRNSLIDYVKSTDAGVKKVKRIYEQVIQERLKARDDEVVKTLRTDLEMLVPRRLVSSWDCTDGRTPFQLDLYSDGTFDSALWERVEKPDRIWRLDKKELIVIARGANAYGQKDLISHCVVSSSGMTLSAEQEGTKWRYNGVRQQKDRPQKVD